jgi:hypothetical protein
MSVLCPRESSIAVRTFECLLDVDGVLCAGLEVGNTAFRLAESHGALRRDLDTRVSSRKTVQPLTRLTILLLSSTSILLPITTYSSQLCSLPCIHLTTYEWEALGVHWASLHQELISPAV